MGRFFCKRLRVGMVHFVNGFGQVGIGIVGGMEKVDVGLSGS